MCQSGNTSSIKAELDGKICSEPLYIWKDWGQLDEPPRTVSSKKGKKKKIHDTKRRGKIYSQDKLNLHHGRFPMPATSS